MRKLLPIYVGLALCSAATSSFAILSVPDGWYLEGNVGASNITDEDYPSGSSSSSSGIGGNVNIGYKFMPYFAAEVGLTRYTNTTIKQSSTDDKAGTDKHYSVDLAGKGIVPISGSGAEVFAKLGIQRLSSKISIDNQTAANAIGLESGSSTATGVYLGVGGQYYFTPEFAGVVQWARAVGNNNTGTLDLWSVGLSYIFG